MALEKGLAPLLAPLAWAFPLQECRGKVKQTPEAVMLYLRHAAVGTGNLLASLVMLGVLL